MADALAAPFSETLRELRKMRYLWQTPIRLDEEKLAAFLGERPYSPIVPALRATLAAMGCLAQDAAAGARNPGLNIDA